MLDERGLFSCFPFFLPAAIFSVSLEPSCSSLLNPCNHFTVIAFCNYTVIFVACRFFLRGRFVKLYLSHVLKAKLPHVDYVPHLHTD